MASGHVRRRGKNWSYVRYVKDPITGKGKQVWKGGFKTQAAAKQALRDALVAAEHADFAESTSATFAEYIDQIWTPHISDQLEESTIESYARNMRVHVIPRIGAIRLTELRPIHLNDLYKAIGDHPIATPQHGNRQHDPLIYRRITHLRESKLTYQAIANTLAEEFPDEPSLTRHAVARIVARSIETKIVQGNLSVTTVRYIHSIISRSLRDAVKLGLINGNPASNASPPRKSKARKKEALWTAEETKRFLQ